MGYECGYWTCDCCGIKMDKYSFKICDYEDWSKCILCCACSSRVFDFIRISSKKKPKKLERFLAWYE